MVTLNHASLVGDGKSQPDGDDVRVLYRNSGDCTWSEVDRALDQDSAWNSSSTKAWFKLQAGISASSSDGDYYLYYGNATAANPPRTPVQRLSSTGMTLTSSLGAQWTGRSRADRLDGYQRRITESCQRPAEH